MRSTHRRFVPVGLILGLAAVLGSAVSAGAADMAVKFDLPDGATVSDTVEVKVKVTGAEDIGVDKVEFAVDGQVKYVDTSIPYSLTWDTLAETEGPHTIVATATDMEGHTAKASITLKVDNELSKGADAHASAALAALAAGKTDDAVRFARRALKIDPSNLKAARALAGVRARMGDVSGALQILEKASMPDSEVQGRAELLALRIAVADTADSTEAFVNGVLAALPDLQKLREARIAAAKNGSAIEKGDALFAARRFKDAALQYEPSADPDTGQIEAINRLLLTYAILGKSKEAQALTAGVERAKRGDDITSAVIGYQQLVDHQFAKARETVQTGIDKGLLSALIVGGYAELAQGKRNAAADLAERAYALAPDLPDVLLLRARTTTDAIDAGKAVARAMQLDPGLPEPYVIRAHDAMLTKEARKWDVAEALIGLALKLDPNSNYALAAMALTLMSRRKVTEAEPYARQLVTQDPNAPDAQMIYAELMLMTDNTDKMRDALAVANREDSRKWGDPFPPSTADLLPRVFAYRLSPVLTPGALYPPARP